MANKRQHSNVTISNSFIQKCTNNVEFLQYRNSEIILYEQWLGNRNIVNKFNSPNNEKSNKSYTGEFTNSAKRNLKSAIDFLLQITKPTKVKHPTKNKYYLHHLSVITLTIPTSEVIHPQEAYNKVLKPFLQYLTKTENVQHYIWKLEFQKRGQIHYHITLPNVIHWKLIRKKWNYLLNKNNYCKEYIEKYGNNDPNSTDIHKVYKIKNIQSYLAKEFIKSAQQVNPNKDNYTDEYKNISYKFWDSSITLKGNKYFKLEYDADTAFHLYNSIQNNDNLINVINTDFAKIIQFKLNSIKQNIPTNQLENYYQHLEQIKSKSTKNKNQQKTIF